MEEVYVVKVKTRPEPSKLYPSERRYSAITVGGLGLVHALLAVTSLLLAALGVAAEGVAASYGAGIALGVAACGAAAVGVLAWRRWYVDNNIRYFLVTSVVSGCAAIVCIVLTSVGIATMQEELALHRLSLPHRAPPRLPTPLPLGEVEPPAPLAHPPSPHPLGEAGPPAPLAHPPSPHPLGVAQPPTLPEQEDGDLLYDDDEDYDELHTNGTELIQKFLLAFESRKNRTDFQDVFANETHRPMLDDYIQPAEEETRTVSSVYEGHSDDGNGKISEPTHYSDDERETLSPATDNEKQTETASPGTMDDGLPYMQYNNRQTFHESANKEARNILSINILIASFLELAWSLLSIRIAWRGMTNDYPDDDGNTRTTVGSETTKSTTGSSFLPKFLKGVKTKGQEVSTVRRPDIISNHRQHLQKKTSVAVVSDDVEQYLPKEESTTEYQERVRRFLASNSDNVC